MRTRLLTCSVACTILLAACGDPTTPSPLAPPPASPSLSQAPAIEGFAPGGSYVVLASAEALSAELEGRIEAAGGSIVARIPEIGAALVQAGDASFVHRGAAIAGVQAVLPNVSVRWIDPVEVAGAAGIEAASFENPPASGDDDFFFDLQWGHRAVRAAQAWNAGLRGAGVRVSILDSGIDAEHPDIAPNLNLGLSTSFVPGEEVNVRPGFYFNHGTHVAGTVAAADNGIGAIGVAPEAEIVAVKVLSEFTTRGSFFGIAQGIVYAASVGSDVINMSIQSLIPRRGFRITMDTPDPRDDVVVSADEIIAIQLLLQRATTWAYQQGSTIVVAAGNFALDRDHDRYLVVWPADLAQVITVSAVAPEGWAQDPFNRDLAVPASYTNYGQSSITFAGPGGDFDFLRDADPPVLCALVLVVPCWVFDGVFSTISDGWGWAQGTSMATPHAAGIAALLIGASGGAMDPAQVEAAMRAAATDLGEPGHDPFYGHGHVSTGF